MDFAKSADSMSVNSSVIYARDGNQKKHFRLGKRTGLGLHALIVYILPAATLRVKRAGAAETFRVKLLSA